MKIHCDLPWGGYAEYETKPREPMSKERFEALCWLIGSGAFLVFFLVLIALS